jgi:hypothetical protein
MKTILICTAALCLSGCASKDYAVYVDAQKSISRDTTVNESAKVQALIEMTKNADPSVRATGIMLLQQLQQNSKQVVVDPPKKNWLGF